ncbi:MAG TPA: SDR family oxidoreductase [Kofleriaceae bacterium]|jgi:NAD(P)-dependent dehydrogenase (short-subunit alcohol dehydrogenase family)
MRYVITGANRGIGHEFARQLHERGDEVIAAMRVPAKAAWRTIACDVGDEASIARFADELGGEAIDVLVNNAGVMGGDELDGDDVIATYRVNAVGPLLLSMALRANLRKGKGKKILHLTSGMGSIADNHSGGAYGYRMSKAALNMMSRSLAMDLRHEGIVSAVINPGWVATDMGGRGAPTSVGDSVRGMLKQLDRITLMQSGEFLSWDGKRWEW